MSAPLCGCALPKIGACTGLGRSSDKVDLLKMENGIDIPSCVLIWGKVCLKEVRTLILISCDLVIPLLSKRVNSRFGPLCGQ